MQQHSNTPEITLEMLLAKDTHISDLGDMNVPLNTEKYEFVRSPVFPVDKMPPIIANLVHALNEGAGYNMDYTMSSMLFAAAVALGGTYKVMIHPGWYEGATIFIALVGSPGTGKTHPLSFAVNPLRNSDTKSFKEYQQLKAKFDANSELPNKDPNKKRLTKPQYKTFLMSDYTPEALAMVHNNNPHGIGIKVDELAGWFGNFNRYNNGSEQEKWLSIWSGETVKVDRKGSDPILIPHPFVCVAGTIQPAVLKKMGGDLRSENGFMDRILFVVPEIKKEPWRQAGISPFVSETWDSIIDNLISLEYKIGDDGTQTPNIILFSSDANKLLREWQADNTDRCNEDSEYAFVGAKMDIYAVRLSLLICALRCASEGIKMTEIGLQDVKGAIALVHYFTSTALQVRRAVKGDSIAMESENKKILFNSLPNQFSTAEGVKTAVDLSISERTAKRFFSDKKIFKKLQHGRYSKILEI